MGIAKRSRSPAQAPVELWDEPEAAQLADSDPSSCDEEPVRPDGIDSPLQRLAIGRGQQDIRRYFRPASKEAFTIGAEAEEAAQWLGLGFDMQEEDADAVAAAAPTDPEVAGIALIETGAAAWAPEEAAAAEMGLGFDMAEEPDVWSSAAEVEAAEQALLECELAHREAACEEAACQLGLCLDLLGRPGREAASQREFATPSRKRRRLTRASSCGKELPGGLAVERQAASTPEPVKKRAARLPADDAGAPPVKAPRAQAAEVPVAVAAA